MSYGKIIEKAKTTHVLTKDEIILLLTENNELLFKAADEVRKKYKGNVVHLRGLTEFSNICRQNCFYCGLRRENNAVERYSLSKEQILNFARNAVDAGLKTIVLQSGEDMSFDVDKMCDIIGSLKIYDVAITLSIGERSFEEYEAFKNAGADRYLLRIETTDSVLYRKLHPGMSFENRKECLYNLKKLGYETGTGIIAGLPGQTISSLADDILFFKELDADMVGIGPLIPHPQTPLKDAPKDNFDIALKVMSVTRLLLPDINIPATTAMETIRTNGRIIALQSGANVVMPNITECVYGKKYEIYPGKIRTTDSPSKCTERIREKIEATGRTIGVSKGFRKDTE